MAITKFTINDDVGVYSSLAYYKNRIDNIQNYAIQLQGMRKGIRKHDMENSARYVCKGLIQLAYDMNHGLDDWINEFVILDRLKVYHKHKQIPYSYTRMGRKRKKKIC